MGAVGKAEAHAAEAAETIGAGAENQVGPGFQSAVKTGDTGLGPFHQERNLITQLERKIGAKKTFPPAASMPAIWGSASAVKWAPAAGNANSRKEKPNAKKALTPALPSR